MVLDYSSYETILFYLFLYHYHQCILFIYSILHLFSFVCLFSIYLAHNTVRGVVMVVVCVCVCLVGVGGGWCICLWGGGLVLN